MIEIKNLVKKFGSKVAVDNLNVTFSDGKIIGFIGPNGAGKTTTIKMMTGILRPDSGQIKLNGYDINTDEISAKEQYGLVFDSPDAFLGLKGLEYLLLISEIYKVEKEVALKRIKELAAKFKMEDDLNNSIRSYSHGMRQKIMIMAVLVYEPKIWLLDEPLTGLDPESSFILKELMRKHAQNGNTVLFSTHVLEVAEKLCDEIMIINEGKLQYQGTLEDIKAKYPNSNLEEVFFKVINHE